MSFTTIASSLVLLSTSYLAVFGSRPSRSSDVLGSSFLGYLSFLHASEFMVPNLSSYSSSLFLSVKDIAMDSSLAPTSMCIRIKGSKTDPSRKGCFLFTVALAGILSLQCTLWWHSLLQGGCFWPLVFVCEWAASHPQYSYRLAQADHDFSSDTRQFLLP